MYSILCNERIHIPARTLKPLEPGEYTKCPLESGHHCTISNPQFSVRKYEREFNVGKWDLCRRACVCVCVRVSMFKNSTSNEHYGPAEA